jgi:hypothetical protein
MVPKMKRVARLLAAIAFLAPVAAFGQVPGGDELAINKTPIIGGTTGRCLYDNAGKVGEQVCAGAATSITINTTTITGGTTTRVLYDNAGTIGEYTNAQLTALINAATASLPGALPAWPNNTTTFFRGDGTYATLNCSALGGSGAFCSGTDAANLTGTVASARLSGSYTGITGVGALAAGSAGAGFSINLTAVTLTNVLPAANGGVPSTPTNATPSATCTTGAPTTITVDRDSWNSNVITWVVYTITLTNIGTCSGILQIPLPSTASKAASFSATNVSTGALLVGQVNASGVALLIYTGASIFPGVSGNTIYASGFYKN